MSNVKKNDNPTIKKFNDETIEKLQKEVDTYCEQSSSIFGKLGKMILTAFSILSLGVVLLTSCAPAEEATQNS